MPKLTHWTSATTTGESLAAAQRAGFTPIGDLVVWIKREQ
jgi:hypothetical protein